MDFRLRKAIDIRSTEVRRGTPGEPAAGRDLDHEIERLIGGGEGKDVVPPYSTDDAAALSLARRFSREKGWWYFEKRDVFGSSSVGWISESQPLLVSVHPIQASGPTRALAICRSLLKVAHAIEERRGASSGTDAARPLGLETRS